MRMLNTNMRSFTFFVLLCSIVWMVSADCAIPNPSYGKRQIQLQNNCLDPIWAAMIGSPDYHIPQPDNGWKIEFGECTTVELPAKFPSLKVWARTNCEESDEGLKCMRGNCQVTSTGGCTSEALSPVSMWEATLSASPTESDVYFFTAADEWSTMSVEVIGGGDVWHIDPALSCQNANSWQSNASITYQCYPQDNGPNYRIIWCDSSSLQDSEDTVEAPVPVPVDPPVHTVFNMEGLMPIVAATCLLSVIAGLVYILVKLSNPVLVTRKRECGEPVEYI